MIKFFRWHRGGWKESIATRQRVNNFADVETIVAKHCEDLNMPGLYYNLSTEFAGDGSDKLGRNWKETYYVKADMRGEGRVILGYCNFPKE